MSTYLIFMKRNHNPIAIGVDDSILDDIRVIRVGAGDGDGFATEIYVLVVMAFKNLNYVAIDSIVYGVLNLVVVCWAVVVHYPGCGWAGNSYQQYEKSEISENS